MRVNVKYEVHGSTITELVNAATREWEALSGQNELPSDTEVDVTNSDNPAYDYKASVYVRVKKETV